MSKELISINEHLSKIYEDFEESTLISPNKSREKEKRLFIELEPNTESVLVDGRINIESRVLLQYGDAEYYMGDPNAKSMVDKGQPRITYVEYFQIGPKSYKYTSTEMSNEQLEKYFGIKIIRFEFSKPIKNEFK